MAVLSSQKFRFLGGEVSPNLYHSADMEQYGRWFSKAENIRFDTLGAFRNRTGFEKVALSKSANGTNIKLLSFSFSREESYLIEMGPSYFRFFQDGQPIYIGGDPDNGVYEVSHTMNIIDTDIKYAQSGDILYLVNGVDPVATLTRNDATGYNWTFAAFKFKDDCPPLQETNTDSAKTLSVSNDNGTITVTSTGHDFFANKAVGDVFAINFEVDAQSAQVVGGVIPAGSTSPVIKTNGKYGFVTTGNWTGVICLQYSLDGVSNWKTFYNLISSTAQTPINANISGIVSTDADVVYMRIYVAQQTGYDTYQLVANLFGEKFSVNSYYKITSKTSNSAAICSSVKNSFAIASGTTVSGLTDWRESAFSSAEGYPSVIGFYQNRLFFGKEYFLYGSRTNNFYDFYEPTTLVADDPITMSLLSYRYNRIRNILTVRKFFVFSEEGEFGITSQGALTQTDKNLIPLSYHGSNKCLPVLAGNLALFVDSSQKCVRLFQYTYETDAFEASDSSVLLEQLLKDRTMVTTDYLKNTKEALFLDDSGTIWVFKLMPEQEIYAWSHWKYAGPGKITNMRVVFNGADEDLYIAVEDTELGEKRIERLSKDVFYDSTYVFTPDNKTKRFFTPFTKGTELIVYLEDTDKRFKVVVQDNGLVELPESGDYIVCHYSYTSTATLLSPVQNLSEGVYTTYNKGKPFKIYFNYQDSFGFKVGVEEEEKMLVKFNSGDRPESTELTSGKRNVLIPARYDGSSRVTFIQDRPYNMSINNVLIDMDYGGK